MLTILVGLTAAFVWSANRRWQLLKVGRPESRSDRLWARLKSVFVFAIAQKRMRNYPLAGAAHMLIFGGFVILLLRTLILWGRGFDPTFSLWILGEEPVKLPGLGLVPLGHVYELVKDVVALLVVCGAAVFLYYRLVKREARMTQSGEAVLILVIITTMMLSDMLYDGAALALHHRHAATVCGTDAELCQSVTKIVAHLGPTPAEAGAVPWGLYPSPVGSTVAQLVGGLSPGLLVVLAHIGFWTHSTLVLVFLNLLPYSKHFHVITSLPNVFARDLTPPGRLPLLAPTAEAIGERVMAAVDTPDKAEPVGIARLEQLSWKALLDFYTCTECGRCSDNCPAHRTGKMLSPKQFTIDLRNHLYRREHELLNRPGGPTGKVDDGHGHGANGHGEGEHAHAEGEHGEGEHGEGHAHDEAHEHGDDHGHHAPVYPDNPVPVPDVASKPIDLVPDVVHPDVLWACTTCRACEEQCPVMISYVDKIVGIRRNLVLVRGEFPAALAGPFQGMEVNGNPWNLARLDRANWAEGLDIPSMADKPDAALLYWVGCAASYDDRAKKIARATATLLRAAGVDFAILGQEETCSGDPARRAGNEYLFAMLAEQNVATLNGYKEKGGVKTILTACPHCFNTLKNEYKDFGGDYEVVHHTDYLLGLVAEKKLTPRKSVEGRVVFHDSCYLGRYHEIYDEPRDILRSIPGVELVEVAEATRHKGLCCGAGGAQMFMEEQNKDRMNVRRTLQLIDTGASTIATACPFCMTMITDGLKDRNKEDDVRMADVAELLLESCGLDKGAGRPTEAEPAAEVVEAAASPAE
ncbi:MAG: (Fe-S)-binding protein [Myxococcales bacterium]|nr:(Fe-S)-binding protein [Myxococcales bacterium]